MFVVNPEILDRRDIFHCKSLYLMRFLTEIKGFNYISREQMEDKKYVWLFIKSLELDQCLAEWKENKSKGEFVFRRKEVK